MTVQLAVRAADITVEVGSGPLIQKIAKLRTAHDADSAEPCPPTAGRRRTPAAVGRRLAVTSPEFDLRRWFHPVDVLDRLSGEDAVRFRGFVARATPDRPVTLLSTKVGSTLRADPVGLWGHIADRLPDPRTEAAADAGVLLLAAVASGTPFGFGADQPVAVQG